MILNREQHEEQLIEAITRYVFDPLGFVLFIFDWGKGELEGQDGPDAWQVEELKRIGEQTRLQEIGDLETAVYIAVRSGHGVGKTALIAWIILWFMSTRSKPQVVVTANTKTQLETKTWRELAVWHQRADNGHWFEHSATKFFHKAYPKTWCATAIPWSRERPQAFAGTHEKYVLMIFDEGSEIPDIIYETAEGAMTTPRSMFIVFGNPTLNTGRFKECFGKNRHLWDGRQVDARTAKMANKAQIKKWIDNYGEDSDFVRVRVKGTFPRASFNQLIPEDLVWKAMETPGTFFGHNQAPLVLGVDVARYGDDETVILARQGREVLEIQRYRELDTLTVAGKVTEAINKHKPDSVFIDIIGYGAGVYDQLRSLKYDVTPVQGSEKATAEDKYYNRRAEMWWKIREWLQEKASLPQDPRLKEDLIGPLYAYDNRGRVQLEKKEDMKARGLASPDSGDALALTFAYPVAHKNLRKTDKHLPQTAQMDYDVHNYERPGTGVTIGNRGLPTSYL